MTELLDDVPRYSMVKEKMTCPSDRIPAVLRTVRHEFAKFQMDTRDGVKVIQPDGWFLVRGSNTEPIVRIVAEAQNEVAARQTVTAIMKMISG